MAISPNQQEQLAQEIRRIYADAETTILERIARRLARGIDNNDWQERKLAEIRELRRQIEREMEQLESNVPEAIREIIEKAYTSGSQSAIQDLKSLFQNAENPEKYGFVEGFDPSDLATANNQAIRTLAESTIQTVLNTHLFILRQSNDIYRTVISETAGVGLTGTLTRREVAQQALNRFANRGISAFRDESGRNWDIASYTEMATRSAIGQASIQGHVNQMQSNERDLVIVSDHPEECELCRPWEGQVLSISGESSEYRSLSEARSDGLFHPGCGHRLGAYIPGLSRNLRGDGDPNGYEERKKQRYMERQVRKWKRREAVAITEQEQKQSKNKVRAWQKQVREFVAENDRRRKYARESITRAR